MFTGIIEEIGTILDIKKGAKSEVLHILAKDILEDLKVGDSVATNGVCLTATKVLKDSYMADVMNETITRSTLGNLKAGSKVNLERAMKADGRFGGHMVSGHIDGVGKIQRITKDDNAIWYKINTSNEILRYIVEKGSIAIDGISLTVAKVDRDSFSISVIPHTSEATTLSNKKVADIVNLENDMVGKYIEKFMRDKSKIDENFLTKHGF